MVPPSLSIVGWVLLCVQHLPELRKVNVCVGKILNTIYEFFGDDNDLQWEWQWWGWEHLKMLSNVFLCDFPCFDTHLPLTPNCEWWKYISTFKLVSTSSKLTGKKSSVSMSNVQIQQITLIENGDTKISLSIPVSQPPQACVRGNFQFP